MSLPSYWCLSMSLLSYLLLFDYCYLEKLISHVDCCWFLTTKKVYYLFWSNFYIFCHLVVSDSISLYDNLLCIHLDSLSSQTIHLLYLFTTIFYGLLLFILRLWLLFMDTMSSQTFCCLTLYTVSCPSFTSCQVKSPVNHMSGSNTDPHSDQSGLNHLH